MSSLRLSPGNDGRKRGVSTQLAALHADVVRCLAPVVNQYWKAALAALTTAGAVLAMLEPPSWVLRAAAWVAVLGFFVALAAAWVQGRPQGAADRAARGRYVLVLAVLVLTPVLLGGSLALPRVISRLRPSHDLSLALLTSTKDPLSLGLAEELRSSLVDAGVGLRVLPLNDKGSYEARGLSMGEIGRELRAADVLELIVRPAGTRLVAIVHLWNSRSDECRWTKRYEETGDLHDLQRQIGEQIADELGVRLSSAQRARLAVAPTANEDAYYLYLEGRGLLYPPVRTLEGNEQAIGRFREALRLDPRFGLAYAGLARGYGVRGQLTGARVWHDSAIAAARQAVALAPREERTHAALGVVLREVGRFDAALAALRDAEALSPRGGDGSGRSNLGLVMLEQGYVQEGVRYGEQAVSIEPRSSTAQWRLGLAYEVLGDDGRAERTYREAVAVAPNAPDARFRLATLYWLRGEAERGEPEMRGFGSGQGWCQVFQWEALNGRLARAGEQARAHGERAWRCAPVLLALVHQGLGNATLASAALDTAASAARDSMAYGHDGSHPRLVLAQVHAMRGELTEANRWFTLAVERGYLHVRAARRLPTLAALRGTPEFERNLQAMERSVANQRRQLEQSRDNAGANQTAEPASRRVDAGEADGAGGTPPRAGDS
ncbi:MAG TPA: tetratricopeptide repeat protein [Longimicrobium sp.]|nr:tetratricopeptide repeat protein [Longimicrobium sp.]